MSKKKRTEEAKKPWERQKGESLEAFEAFCVYRDMGLDRSIRKVGQNLDKTRTQIGDWSKKYNWVSRVEAWADEQDRLTREALVKGVTSMRKQHTQIAMALLAKAAKRLQNLPEKDIRARDVVTMIEVAAKLERLSRDEATEKIESKSEITGADGQPFSVCLYLPEKEQLE